MSNLQQLDEALDYLNEENIEPVNEGIIQKLLDYREKKRKEKALKEKDKKDMQERGYTDYQYKSAKENLKSFVDWENDKPINIMNMNNFDLPSALFYCNISESQFITSFNKFITSFGTTSLWTSKDCGYFLDIHLDSLYSPCGILLSLLLSIVSGPAGSKEKHSITSSPLNTTLTSPIVPS